MNVLASRLHLKSNAAHQSSAAAPERTPAPAVLAGRDNRLVSRCRHAVLAAAHVLVAKETATTRATACVARIAIFSRAQTEAIALPAALHVALMSPEIIGLELAASGIADVHALALAAAVTQAKATAAVDARGLRRLVAATKQRPQLAGTPGGRQRRSPRIRDSTGGFRGFPQY